MENTKTINELINKFKAKKKELISLENSDNTKKYTESLEEIKNLKNTINALFGFNSQNIQVKEESYISALKANSGLKVATEKDKAIINYMSEADDLEGGLLVDEDIQRDVKVLRETNRSLESLITIDKATKNKGARTVELRAEEDPLEIVEEGESIPEVETQKLKEVSYEIAKRSGIIKVSNELLNDSGEIVLAWIKKWLAKKTRATRNYAIISKINEITAGDEIEVTDIDDLKTLFNVTLDSSAEFAANVITNQNGFNWLSSLKDADGKYLVSFYNGEESKPLLFNKYPITKVSQKLFPDEAVMDGETIVSYKYPIVCGDFKEALTLFDRENLSIEISKHAGFYTDQSKIKVKDRFDIQDVDSEAIIKAYVNNNN